MICSRHSGRESPCILFHIPDGTATGMMNQGKAAGKTSSSTKGGSSKDKGVNALIIFQWSSVLGMVSLLPVLAYFPESLPVDIV